MIETYFDTGRKWDGSEKKRKKDGKGKKILGRRGTVTKRKVSWTKRRRSFEIGDEDVYVKKVGTERVRKGKYTCI